MQGRHKAPSPLKGKLTHPKDYFFSSLERKKKVLFQDETQIKLCPDPLTTQNKIKQCY